MEIEENMELRAMMGHDLLNQVACGLSGWTCAAMRGGKTMIELADAAGMTTDRWWNILERNLPDPTLHEVACMAFALGVGVKIAFPAHDDIPF
jgi:hypothetical protein